MIADASHHVCYGLAKAFLKPPLARFGFRNPAITQYCSREHLIADRVSTIKDYETLFSSFASFRNKVVMEVGCSAGYLLNAFLSKEEFTAIGADINEEALASGRQEFGDRIRFVKTTLSEIPVPSNSVDIVYSVDTVEHLTKVRDIVLEVYRILRPGGLALIHFCPWSNPYGSHLTEIIPFPWPHVLFSMETLLGVASRIYDSPDYEAAWYYLDQKTGQKKPNPYRDLDHWNSYLNRMSIRGFNRLIKETPFEYVHQERIGFGGKTFRIGKLVKMLAQAPLADEFFCYALYTVLRKPMATQGLS